MMHAILAIVGDTRRQSRQQVVFMVMLGIMALLLIAGLALPKTSQTDSGKVLELRFVSEQISKDLPTFWSATALGAVGMSVDNELGTSEEAAELDGDELTDRVRERRERQKELRQAILDRRDKLTDYEASVQFWVYLVCTFMFTITLPLFIAACAGYFPGLMSSGAIDVVLAKPVSRLTVFAGKYFGGLALFGAALLAFHTLLLAGTGIMTGVWHFQLLTAIGMELFIAAVLYALLALLGITSRGPLLPLLLGLVMYLVIDSILGQLQMVQQMGMFDEGWFDTAIAFSRDWIPNFTRMKQSALISILNSPSTDWGALGVGGFWMVYSLGHGYWLFNRRDY